MKKIITATLSCFVLALVSVSAQTFNPRVEVENTYEGKLVEAGKNALPMSVPDSLYKFQYQLDYSVFDNPYRGSYKFQPYKIEMKPDPVPSAARRLYVNLGAGWSLHPELDVIWSPILKNRPLKLSVYDNLRGFLGNYGLMGYAPDYSILAKPTQPVMGYVVDNKAGANFRYEFQQVALEFDGGYRLFTSTDSLTSHFLQLAETEIRLLPLDPNKADYFYGGRLYVNAGQDRYQSPMSGRHKFGINDMGADLRFGAPAGAYGRILLDLGMQSVVYSGVLEAVSTRVWATPRYNLRWRGGEAEVGVKVSYLKGSDRTAANPSVIKVKDDVSQVFQHKSDILYPAVKVKQYLIPDHLAVYAKAVGGDELNAYTDLLRSNPFFDPLTVVNNMDTSSERVNASVGFEGDVAGRFQFDLHGGYAILHNWKCDAVEFLDGIYVAPDEGWKGHRLSSYYNYCDYNQWYADLSFLWKSPRLDLDGHFLFRDTDLLGRDDALAVAPARFSGELRAVYNWNRQAFAGISLEAASRRQGNAIRGFDELYGELYRFEGKVTVPGWVDLGLYGRYVLNPRWSFWVKVGNLLGQSVQHYFLHPEKGPYGTIGFSFNL